MFAEVRGSSRVLESLTSEHPLSVPYAGRPGPRYSVVGPEQELNLLGELPKLEGHEVRSTTYAQPLDA